PMIGVRPTLRQGLGVLLGLGMVAILFGDAVSAHGVPLWAMILAVAVPFCYAVSNTWVKLRFHDTDSLLLSALVMGIGLIFMMPVARLNEVPLSDVSIGKSIASVAFLGIVGSGLAMWMFYKLIQLRGPLFAGMVTYVVPGIAVLLGWALEDEVVTTWQILALVGIVISVALVQWPASAKPPTDTNEI
ncbi:MAG: DMT family transporter, partial [Pseudomonadota bacterium]